MTVGQSFCCYFFQWCQGDILSGHSGAVIAVSGITVDLHGHSRTIVATSSADSTVRIWTRSGDKGIEIKINSFFARK